MTSDARIPTKKDPNPTDKAPTDPPVYSEVSTPDDVEERRNEDKD
jgi:hypothetical protein